MASGGKVKAKTEQAEGKAKQALGNTAGNELGPPRGRRGRALVTPVRPRKSPGTPSSADVTSFPRAGMGLPESAVQLQEPVIRQLPGPVARSTTVRVLGASAMRARTVRHEASRAGSSTKPRAADQVKQHPRQRRSPPGKDSIPLGERGRS